MEIVGAVYWGRALDSNEVQQIQIADHNKEVDGYCKGDEKTDAPQKISRRESARRCLLLFFFVNSTGNVLAFVHEHNALAGIERLDITDTRSFLPSLAFACWGFADSQIQVYCYWLMGALYSSFDHSRAVGFYKCIQSLGYSMGFYLIPVSRLSAITQLSLSSFIFVVGTGLSLFELPK